MRGGSDTTIPPGRIAAPTPACRRPHMPSESACISTYPYPLGEAAERRGREQDVRTGKGQGKAKQGKGYQARPGQTYKLWRPSAGDEHHTCPPPEPQGHPSRTSATRETRWSCRGQAHPSRQWHYSCRTATTSPDRASNRAHPSRRWHYSCAQTEHAGGARTSTRLAGGRTRTARGGGEQASCNPTPYSPTAVAYGLRGWALRP